MIFKYIIYYIFFYLPQFSSIKHLYIFPIFFMYTKRQRKKEKKKKEAKEIILRKWIEYNIIISVSNRMKPVWKISFSMIYDNISNAFFFACEIKNEIKQINIWNEFNNHFRLALILGNEGYGILQAIDRISQH